MATNTKSVFGYSKECVQQERCTQSKGTAATQLQWIVARTERSLVLPHCLTYFLRETRNLYFLWKSSNFFLSFQLSFQAVLVKSIIFGKLLPESQQFPSMFLKEVFTSIRVLSGYKLLTGRERKALWARIRKRGLPDTGPGIFRFYHDRGSYHPFPPWASGSPAPVSPFDLIQ